MARSNIVPISERSAVGIADKSASDACFNDWKRFCFVLREIASGENGRPLPSFEAQKRAQAVLTECGYTWPGQTVAPEPNGALDMPSKPENEVKKPARKSERGTR